MDKQARIKAVEEKLAECQKELERIRAEEEFVPKRIGDFFVKEGSRYILAMVDTYSAGLISLRGGNRYRNPVKVEDSVGVSTSEWVEICGNPSEWSKVGPKELEKNG